MSLDTLLQRRDIWRGGQLSPAAADGLPTGFGPLDAVLPGGGWPRGALTEILTTQEGIGELRRAQTDALWATEQALRSGTCATVLAWPRQSNDRTLRRLQLAAEAGKTCGFLFHYTQGVGTPSPAALRLRLEPNIQGLSVHILKCRGSFIAGPIVLTLPRSP
jgi:cell division inhibitor SulA/protein ImuA